MASAYSPAGARPDIQVLSPTAVQDVQIVSGHTVPSNVYFELPVNIGTWERDQGVQAMTAVAGAIEDILTWQYVAGAVFTQDLDANGLIQDYIRFTITIPTIGSQPGPFTTTIDVYNYLLYTPFSNWTPIVKAQVDAAVAVLSASQNASPTNTTIAPPPPPPTSTGGSASTTP